MCGLVGLIDLVLFSLICLADQEKITIGRHRCSSICPLIVMLLLYTIYIYIYIYIGNIIYIIIIYEKIIKLTISVLYIYNNIMYSQ